MTELIAPEQSPAAAAGALRHRATVVFVVTALGSFMAALDLSIVNVAFADPGSDPWVSVSGEAAVVNDPAKAEQLWSKMNDAWFKGGPRDPDLALVQVRIVHASYWDVKESQIVQLWKMAKAAVTGEPPHLGEHGEVRLR